MVTRRHFLGFVGAGATILAVPGMVVPSVAFAADSRVKAFLGTYQYAGGKKQRAALDKAIEDAVADLNGLIRGIARDRLKEANAIANEVDFKVDKKSLTVSADARPYTAPLDGRKTKVRVVTGDEMDLHYAFEDERIDQIFLAEDKGRRNRFTVDGETLTMQVTVFASQLPKKLNYKLTYKRS